jgi:threonyl-tRNA synthetase
MIKITLPDGSIREFEGAVSPLEVAKSISEGLARNTISALVDGKQVEVTTPITQDATVTLLTWNDDLGKKLLAFFCAPFSASDFRILSSR